MKGDNEKEVVCNFFIKNNYKKGKGKGYLSSSFSQTPHQKNKKTNGWERKELFFPFFLFKNYFFTN
jgi:hypothetical protein